MAEIYLGLISGTSVDGVDAALVDLSVSPRLLHSHCHPIPPSLKKKVSELCSPGSANNDTDKIDLLGETDIALGLLFAEAANTLIDIAGIEPASIRAIGSHGQTIRHRPPQPQAGTGSVTGSTRSFTLQIADPNTIAHHTGITTVADFRRRDMAAGGQGAPLAPAFHRAIAPTEIETCAFLNLGGIANLTLIHSGEIICAYDTGPANGLMDAYCQQAKQLPYDENGSWAKSGTVSEALLAAMLDDPYFSQPWPKSTGREYFNIDWLTKHTTAQANLPGQDIQATLLALTATTVANEVAQLPMKPRLLYCCGGGVHNNALMETLQKQLPGIALENTTRLGIGPDWIEACTFGWLAKQALDNTPLELGAVTGAKSAGLLGGIYPASN